jgi:hypothetical protein
MFGGIHYFRDDATATPNARTFDEPLSIFFVLARFTQSEIGFPAAFAPSVFDHPLPKPFGVVCEVSLGSWHDGPLQLLVMRRHD